MPQDKDLKRLVRLRMQQTGERYTQAKTAVDNRAEPAAGNALHRQWVTWLGDKSRQQEGFRLLKALPDDELRPLAVAGASHDNWRIRRGCCRLLDDLAITADSLAALETCLEDPEPRVRRAALHTLSCQHCKPEGCVLDQRAIFERMITDRNRRVREGIVGTLEWTAKGGWQRDLLVKVAQNDPSVHLRATAQKGLNRIELMRRTNRERQELPPDLRAKTERHQGKWVSISGGRIIATSWGHGVLERAARRHGRTDARIYWVEDDENRFPDGEAQP